MTPEQCRAARGWLNWTQAALAERSRTGLSTVKDFEAGRRAPMANNLVAIQAALEKEGIGFAFDDGKKPCGITYTSPKKAEVG